MRLMDHGVSTSLAAHRAEYIPRFNIESVGNLPYNLFLDRTRDVAENLRKDEKERGERKRERQTFKRHFRCKSGAPSR